jgi:hypothetical protein
MGVDLGKYQDFTVIDVLDGTTGQVVHHDRFGDIDWTLQKSRIIHTAHQWQNPHVLIDSTGLGDPIFDDLQRAGLWVDGYKFTSVSKQHLIERLMVAFEQGQITIPADDQLINELQAFEYKIGPTGRMSYSAPSGLHDDCVMALALAVWNYRPDQGGLVIGRPSSTQPASTIKALVDQHTGLRRATWHQR